MVKHRIVDGEETEPAIGDVLGDGGTQSPEGGDVVQRADEQRPDHHFGVDGGTAVVGAVAILQGSNQPGEFELLVDPYQQVVRVDEIPQTTGSELEQGGASSVPVQWLQHPSAPYDSSTQYFNSTHQIHHVQPGFFNKPLFPLIT